jgi:hypothetical protein
MLPAWYATDNVHMPRLERALPEVAYVPAPTAAPDQSGVCGAVACPAPRAPFAWEGRVEHVVSGQVTHFHTLEELLAFMRRVLAEVSEQRG